MLSMEQLQRLSPNLSSLLQSQPGRTWSLHVPSEPLQYRHGQCWETWSEGKGQFPLRWEDLVDGERWAPLARLLSPSTHFSSNYPWHLPWRYPAHPQHCTLVMGNQMMSGTFLKAAALGHSVAHPWVQRMPGSPCRAGEHSTHPDHIHQENNPGEVQGTELHPHHEGTSGSRVRTQICLWKSGVSIY